MRKNFANSYDRWQINPSQEKALPVILESVFNTEWLLDRTYENEAKFCNLELFYRERYPNLFDQVSALAAVRANTQTILENVDETMRHYYRGASIALLAMELSAPDEYFQDIPSAYVEVITETDMIEIERWLLKARLETADRTEALRGYINDVYPWLAENDYLKTAMHIGAQYTYIMMAHSRACVAREKEIAWITRDDESFEGWIEYCQGANSGERIGR